MFVSGIGREVSVTPMMPWAPTSFASSTIRPNAESKPVSQASSTQVCS